MLCLGQKLLLPYLVKTFFFFSFVKEKIKAVEEFIEAICLELDLRLMKEELENNNKYELSVKTSGMYV